MFEIDKSREKLTYRRKHLFKDMQFLVIPLSNKRFPHRGDTFIKVLPLHSRLSPKY